jgi:hypothetical protein
MIKSPLTTVLLAALLISALASVGFCCAYIYKAREVRGLQGQIAGIQNNRAFIAAVANEAVEYSKKNPEIDPILEAAGLKPAKISGSGSTNKAGVK